MRPVAPAQKSPDNAKGFILLGCFGLIVFLGIWMFWAAVASVSLTIEAQGRLDFSAREGTQGVAAFEGQGILAVQTENLLPDPAPATWPVTLALGAREEVGASNIVGEVVKISPSGQGSKVTIHLHETSVTELSERYIGPETSVSMVIQPPAQAPISILLSPLFAYFHAADIR